MSKPILITAPVGNNPARCRMLIYHKGLEETIDMKSPADYGGLASPEYRKLNPQGKMPALILPSGETLYEAKVVLQYLNDKYGAVGPPIGADTPELGHVPLSSRKCTTSTLQAQTPLIRR